MRPQNSARVQESSAVPPRRQKNASPKKQPLPSSAKDAKTTLLPGVADNAFCTAAATSVLMVQRRGCRPGSAGVTAAGLELQEAYAGRPEQAKLTLLLKPPDGAMLMVEVVALPGVIVALAGLSELTHSVGVINLFMRR
jgi:hypothetical protein